MAPRTPRAKSRRSLLPAVAPALVLAAIAASPAPGTASEWVGLGPEGGDVQVLEASPTVPGLIFAGLAQGGVYRSADGGASWRPARDGLVGVVFDLAAHPTDPDTVYAGTSHGVYATHDGGETWERASAGLTRFRRFLVQSIEVAPSAPGTLYAGTARGVWKSKDGGGTWRPARAGLPEGQVTTLAVHPDFPNILLAGIDFGGVFKSTDGGASWARSGSSFGRGPGHPWPTDLAVAHDEPPTVYAVLRLRASELHASTDFGSTWAPVGPRLIVEGDRSWPTAAAVDPRFPEVVVVGGPWGLLRSRDGGETWEAPAEGVRGHPVEALEIAASAPDTVLAGTRIAGVFRSTDAGEVWRESSSGLTARPLGPLAPPAEEVARGLVVDPRGVGKLFAIGQDESLFLSDDCGASWSRPGGELAVASFRDLRIHPLRPSMVHARAYFGPDLGWPPRELLYRSLDSGRTWHAVGDGLPAVGLDPFLSHGPLHWDSRVPGALYLRLGETVYQSFDDAETWSVRFERLPGALIGYAPTPGGRTLFVWDRVLGEKPCIGLGCPGPPLITVLFKSVNRGRQWVELERFGSDLEAAAGPVFLDPSEPSLLYAVVDGDLERSTDGGATFSPYLSTPIEPLGSRPGEGRAAGEVEDPLLPGVSYRSSLSKGVERSADGGKTWQPFDQGLAATWVKGLVLLPVGPRVLLASSRAGVWARPLGDGPFPPPPGPPMTAAAFPGFRFWVRIVGGDGRTIPTRGEAACIPETLCVSGAVPGRTEMLLRIVGPKANGYLWPTLVKLTTSQVEVWIEQTASGQVRYYRLPAARPGVDELPGLFDRRGFLPVPGEAP